MKIGIAILNYYRGRIFTVKEEDMKFTKKHEERVKEILAGAYHAKEKIEVGDSWHVRVMAHIRNLGPLDAKQNSLELFAQYLWRFSPVLCLFIFVLAVFLVKLQITPDFDIAKIFLEDPVQFSLLQTFMI